MFDPYRTVRYEAFMNEPAPKILAEKPVEEMASDAPSKREQEVLSAVLDLMVREGGGFSMAAVAKQASCSKETLYRWFGDRDGLLTATVRWQAAKVIMPELNRDGVTLAAFSLCLREFAESWLQVITGDISVALNRLAVSHAGNNKTNLGKIVLENGPFAMRERLQPIFELGHASGFLNADPEEAFRTFFGLVVADTQIRALLGETRRPDTKDIRQFAQGAVEQFLTLCGNPTTKPKHTTGE